MKKKLNFISLAFIVLICLSLAASGCGTSSLEPAPAAVQEPVKAEQASIPKEEPKEELKPADSEKAGQDAEWEKIVAAAKAEGKLVMASAPSELYRDALVTPFQEKYPEIQIEYTGSNGRDFWPKLMQERTVGQYLWDISIIGTDAIGWEKAKEVSEPIRPLLRPELMKDEVWVGGLDMLFMDKENEYFPGFLGYSQNPVTVNRDFLSEEEITSPEQLIDPKFKGKIVIQDPRGGAGLGSLAIMYAHYGEEYVRKLLTEQDTVVTSDNRQIVEWVVRGKYPIGIGFDSTNLLLFQEKGLGLNIKDLQEGPVKLSRGFSSTVLLKDAPHPNAAKVYLNWLYSKEGQSRVAELLKLNSLMVGVEPGDKNAVVETNQLERYIPHQSEELGETRRISQKLAQELIKQ